MDDGWERLGDSAVDGGLLFLIAVVVQMFVDLGRRIKCHTLERVRRFIKR